MGAFDDLVAWCTQPAPIPIVRPAVHTTVVWNYGDDISFSEWLGTMEYSPLQGRFRAGFAGTLPPYANAIGNLFFSIKLTDDGEALASYVGQYVGQATIREVDDVPLTVVDSYPGPPPVVQAEIPGLALSPSTTYLTMVGSYITRIYVRQPFTG